MNTTSMTNRMSHIWTAYGRTACLAILIGILLLTGCGRVLSPTSYEDADKTSTGNADTAKSEEGNTSTESNASPAKNNRSLSKLKKEDMMAVLSILSETITNQFLFEEILPEKAEVSSWHYTNGGGQYWEGVNEADYRIDKAELQSFYAALLRMNPNEPPLDSVSGYFNDTRLEYALTEQTDNAGKPFIRVTLNRKAVDFGKHLPATDLLQGLPFPVPDLSGTKLVRFVYDAPAHEKNGGFFWLIVYDCEPAMEDVFATYEAMYDYQTLENHRMWKSDEGTACEIVGEVADSDFTIRVEKNDASAADPLDGRTYRTRVEIRLTDDSGRLY